MQAVSSDRALNFGFELSVSRITRYRGVTGRVSIGALAGLETGTGQLTARRGCRLPAKARSAAWTTAKESVNLTEIRSFFIPRL
jgi:hypothetical protein